MMMAIVDRFVVACVNSKFTIVVNDEKLKQILRQKLFGFIVVLAKRIS